MRVSRKFGCLVLLVLLLFAPTVNAQQSKVRGRVVRKVESTKYPAAYIRVSFAPSAQKDRRKFVYTGSDGMFYFTVPAGNYVIELWNADRKPVASYNVAVKKPNVDIEMQLP